MRPLSLSIQGMGCDENLLFEYYIQFLKILESWVMSAIGETQAHLPTIILYQAGNLETYLVSRRAITLLIIKHA